MAEDESIDFGDVYLATDAQDPDNAESALELFLLVVRDPQKTIRLHGKIYLSQLEDGDKPPIGYCVDVYDGKFVNLKAEPDGATTDEIKRLKLISKLSENQKMFFMNILEGIERRSPGNLKYYGD